ncbi:hypothetical protein AB0O18_09365 [Streptomyces sp. NPDC093224]|uniref:hypothetical protein n=1 Tax=Streptomyces sp. NPDC093224 TaxID=3155198 RepID=UPI00342F0D0A
MAIETGTDGCNSNQQAPGSAAALPDSKEQRDRVVSEAEYAWLQAAAELYVFAEQRGLLLVRADGPNGHLLSQAMVFDSVLLLPPGRHPKDVLQDVGADPLGGSADTAP